MASLDARHGPPYYGNLDGAVTWSTWFYMSATGFQLVRIGGIDGAFLGARTSFDR